MANHTNSTSAFTVHRAVGHVVLTMAPQQAQQLAASIWPEDAEHTWLDTLPDMLRAAAHEHPSPAQSPHSVSQQQAQAALLDNMARIRHDGPDSASPYNATMEQAQAALAHNARFRHNGFDASSYPLPTTAPAVVRSTAEIGMTYAEALVDKIEAEPTAPQEVAAVAITNEEAHKTDNAATEAVSAENARALAATLQAAATAKAENTVPVALSVARAAETAAAVHTSATPRAD